MGRTASLKRLSRVLEKTLRDLEQRPDVDPHDPAFISLKCTLLSRILDVRAKVAEVEASIHLVEPPEPESEPKVTDSDEAIA